MLTRKYLKTIIVNLGVNYRQFEVIFVWVGRMRLAHWQPQTKNLAKSECKDTAKIYFFQILHALSEVKFITC